MMGHSHLTQWEWPIREAICELPKSSPNQGYGNWETADGMSFFCQWIDVCPAREDALRGTLLCHLDGNHNEYGRGDDFYDADF